MEVVSKICLAQRRSQRSRLRILEAAFESFRQQGYTETTFRHIAEKAGISLGLICRYFPTKESIVLALYEQLAARLEAYVADLPQEDIGSRFAAVMKYKISLLTPHRRMLAALFGKALDPMDEVGVFSQKALPIRAKLVAIFQVVVAGAKNAPHPEQQEAWSHSLYALHLLLILAWLQDRSSDGHASHTAVELVSSLIKLFGPLLSLALPPLHSPLGRLDTTIRQLLQLPQGHKSSRMAPTILRHLFTRRRLLHGALPASDPNTASLALHLEKVEAFVRANEPIHLVLPAFPAKSPNSQKVLGSQPDLAEWLALESLNNLCKEIGHIYPKGARITICSDGHVFSDLVGISEQHVKKYRTILESMIKRLNDPKLDIFGLEDAFGTTVSSEARARLLKHYGSSQKEFQEQVHQSISLQTQIDGIHRFLSEDEHAQFPNLSRNQAQKLTRPRAYEVVARSAAWSRLIHACFPQALRLSIHPQPEVSDKIGIHLLPTQDEWLTPWHGAAVLDGNRVRLMKRAEAEILGARLLKTVDGLAYLELPT